MTVQKLVEEINQMFPQLGETQIVEMVNSAQKRFAGETRILTKAGQLTNPSTNITWTLPSDLKEVTEITFYNTNDMPLYMDDLDLAYEIVFGKITFINSDGSTKLTGLPSSVIYAYVDYVHYPATIDDITDSLEIDEEFHEGITADIFERLYARYPIDTMTGQGVVKLINMNLVTYWGRKYKEMEIKAKRRANVNKDAINSEVKKDNLGNPINYRRQRLSTTNTITFSALNSIYSKYIRFTAVEGGAITINEQFGWTTEIATPTETSYVITVVSTSEFTETMLPEASKFVNNGRVDANTWTFELFSGYGTMSFEIKEY